MAQAVSCRPLTTEALRAVLLLVLRFFPFNIIPPVLHTNLQLQVPFTRTKMWNEANTAESNALSNIEENRIERNFHVIFITAKAQVWSLFSFCEILMGEMALEQIFLQILRFSPAIIISATVHTHRLHSHVTLSRRTTSSQPGELSEKSCLFVHRLACARIFVHRENEIKMACRLHVLYAYAGKFYFKNRKRLLGSPRHRRNQNIKMDLKEVLQRLYETVLSAPGRWLVTNFCEHCNETLILCFRAS